MISALIASSLRHRMVVLLFSALLVVYGGYVLLRLPVDVFPDLNRPTVTLLTEAPGLAPEEVEMLVTIPLETALNGAAGVSRVRSNSGIGLSIVAVEFGWNTAIDRARQVVQERLQLASERLPAGIRPTMGPVSSIMGEIMLVGLSTSDDRMSGQELRAIADWTLRSRLAAIPGVSQIITIGGGVSQIEVGVLPEKMAAYSVSLAEVVAATEQSQGNSPGGYLANAHREVLIRNIGRSASLEDLAKAVVAVRGGVAVTLGDVATIARSRAVMRGDAGVNGQAAVILSVQKQPGADTVALTRRIEGELAQLSAGLPVGVTVTPLFRQANFIESAISNVEAALRDGAIIVALVLLVFLLNARTTIITLTAIPLSLVFAVIIFQCLGLGINTMTLGGLAIAIGEMVDDAIVDVENVFRRLRENAHAQAPRPTLRVVYEASVEIRSSIVLATVVVICVFLPLFALQGIEGRLFAPIGIAYVTAILASLVVAVTVTPVLCALLLPGQRLTRERGDGLVVRTLKEWDRRYVLPIALRHSSLVMTLAAAMVVGAVALLPLMGRDFLPQFNEGTATISVLSAPGTSLSESNRVGTIAERLLLTIPEVRSVGRRTGRAELDEHAEGVHSTELDVDFVEGGRARSDVIAAVRQKLAELPGVVVSVGQPISHRLDHILSGVRAQIALKLYGPDLETLRGLAARVEETAKNIVGIVDLQVEKQVQLPQVRIEVNRDALRTYGLSVGAVLEFLETALNGRSVGQVVERERVIDLVVRLQGAMRSDLSALHDLLVDIPSGGKVPLRQLATVREARGPNIINREDLQRRIVVQANVSGRDLGATVRELQDRVAREVVVPPGYHLQVEGQFQSEQAATKVLLSVSAVSLSVIFLVLFGHFRSVSIVFQILLNIPLALVGGFVATYVLVGTISVASVVGFIAVAGIATRNTIMMISHYLHLMREEGEAFTETMIVRASLERLVPVAMTALTAGLALLPLLVAAGEPGKEILYPVAVVILGGLVSATLLDIVVTPAVFFRFGRKAAERYCQRELDRNANFNNEGVSV